MKKALWLVPWVFVLVLAACAQKVSPKELQQDFFVAVDKGDVAAALALLTDDAVYEAPGCPPGGCKGKDAIKAALEGLVAQHPRHTIKSTKVSGDIATSRVEAEVDFAKAAGAQRLVANVALTRRGEKIARYKAELDTADQQTATAANFLLVTSLAQQVPDALNRGDVAAAVAPFTDDAVVEGLGICTPCKGKEAIQKEWEREVALKTRVTVTSSQVSGNTATTRFETRAEPIKATGEERIVGTAAFEVRGDKIAALRAQLDLSDAQTGRVLNFLRLSGLLRQHYDAVNKGDVAAALAFFTDDAVLVRGGCAAQSPCKGKAEIQRQVQTEVANQTRVNVTDTRVAGQTVTARTEARNVNIQNAGIERVIFNATVTFVGDKISRLVSERDDSDAPSAAFANFQRVAQVVAARGLAFRRGDVAGVMSLVTDDAVVEGLGLCAASPCTGKAAIQKEIERQVADKNAFIQTPGTERVVGDTFTSRGELRSDSIKAAGVERIIVSTTIVVKGNKISSVRQVPDTSDPQTAAYLRSQGK